MRFSERAQTNEICVYADLASKLQWRPRFRLLNRQASLQQKPLEIKEEHCSTKKFLSYSDVFLDHTQNAVMGEPIKAQGNQRNKDDLDI